MSNPIIGCACEGTGHDSNCWVLNPARNRIHPLGRDIDDLYNLVAEIRDLLASLVVEEDA